MEPQFARILAQLLDAGLAETHIDADGHQIIRLTPDGERVARQLAMLDEEGQEALLAGLLEDDESSPARQPRHATRPEAERD